MAAGPVIRTSGGPSAHRPLGPPQVTLETTIGNKNPDLWKYVKPEGCVMEWVRNTLANRLAVDGGSWADVFKRFNSGT